MNDRLKFFTQAAVFGASGFIVIATLSLIAARRASPPPVMNQQAQHATTALQPTRTDEPSTHTEFPPQVVSSTEPALPVASGERISPSQAKNRTQYVLLAFDGSYSIQMWKDTRAFAQQLTQSSKPLHFTYFISGVYLLTDAASKTYQAPYQKPGVSAIKFATTKSDVASRVEQMNLAMSEGNEIGSHANGHFSGTTWNATDWRSELSQFKHITENVSTINGLDQEPPIRQKLNLPPQGIVGFRAPELGSSPAMWPVLKELGYRYDTSKSGKADLWPTKDSNGLWQFPLARINYNTSTSPILSMDYNFFFKQTKAQDILKKGTPEWDRYYNETLTSFNRYFDTNYNGTRAPVQIGNHFSTWNDGMYWEAMKALAERVCGLPDVKCVTMSEMMNELEAQK